jgi:hypothetical protein
MGLAYNVYLNSNKIYGCKNCKAHLSNHEDIISRVSIPVVFGAPLLLDNINPSQINRADSLRTSGVNMAKLISSTASSTILLENPMNGQ